MIFHPFAGGPTFTVFGMCPGVLGLRMPKIGGFSLTLIVALTTVLRTNVLHCDYYYITQNPDVVAKF